MNPALLIVISALVLGFLFTLISENFGRRLGIVDKPDRPLAIHAKPIPRTGGLGLLLALGIIWLISAKLNVVTFTASELCTAALLFGLGLWDDIRPRPAKLRLVFQMAIYVVSWLLGIRIELTGLPVADFAFGLVTFIVVVNAVNFYDGMDGLVALTSVVSLGIWAAVAGDAGWVWLPFAAGAALISGFLVRNWHPAKIFLGDGGSFIVGFLFYLIFVRTGPAEVGVVPGFWVAAVPVCDAVTATFDRMALRRDIWTGDRDHIYDILSRFGLSVGRVALVLGLLSALLARATDQIISLQNSTAWLFTAAVYAGLISIIWWLRRRYRT